MKRLYMALAAATLATMSFAQPLSTYRSMKDNPTGKPVDIVMSPVGNKTAMLTLSPNSQREPCTTTFMVMARAS